MFSMIGSFDADLLFGGNLVFDRNDGYDNAEGDFICRVNDVIANPEGYGYEIADRLGHGTFGQVLRCVTCDNRSVAVKIIKNKPAYFQQALVEVRILQLLNRYYDTRIVKMTDYFVYRKHLCIVFEQLSMNLYDVLKQNSFRGLPVNMIKSIMDQLLRALVCLQTQGIIHCDLKPENILLVTKRNTKIKLIDFGSAAFSGYQVYTYIQSRFYRSPDVILGIHPFTTAIDMWSLGCILAELFLGLPLFPGSSEKDQLTRILALMGSVPCGILDKGRNTG
ncbi:dual specificity protein kinase yak1, partial [Perkinsus olseni]